MQEEREKRPHDLLICAEIVPVLPNLSTEDRQLVRFHQSRQLALVTVIRAVDDLLADRTGRRSAIVPSTILASNQPAPLDTSGEAPAHATDDVQEWAAVGSWSDPEPSASHSKAKTRRLKTPVAIVAALVMLAVVAALGLRAVSSSSTHVAATKTPARAGTPKDAQTSQPPAPTSAAPPPAAAPPTTVPNDAAEGTVPDYAVPPLAAATPTTAVVCPAGRVTATVNQVQAQQSPSDATAWDMTITGTLTNGTVTPIVTPSVNVTITTSNGTEPAYGDSNSSQLAPGQSASWNATSYVSSTTRPSATAQPGTWAWADPRYADCPSGDQRAATAN